MRSYLIDTPICRKCGREYESMDEGFYYSKGRGYRRPCKQCIREYNKRPDQYEMRLKANRKYKNTEKGKKANKKSAINRRRKNG